MPKKVAKVNLDQDMGLLIKEWKEAADKLAEVKSIESQLRLKIVASAGFKAEKLEGTETLDIGWGWKLKATKNLNLTATNASRQTEELLANVGVLDPALAQSLVRWQPELSTKAYRDLQTLLTMHPELNKFAAAAITVKPGMPELELIPPKEEAPAVESNVPAPVEA